MSDETKASATVSDYLRWRGDLTFAQDGFNEVDNLLLCIISYIKLENIPRLRSFDPQDAMPMGDVCRLLTEEDEQLGLSTLDYIPLMRQAAETPRFREVSLFAFESLHDEDRQMQFAAVSFLLPDGSVFIATENAEAAKAAEERARAAEEKLDKVKAPEVESFTTGGVHPEQPESQDQLQHDIYATDRGSCEHNIWNVTRGCQDRGWCVSLYHLTEKP